MLKKGFIILMAVYLTVAAAGCSNKNADQGGGIIKPVKVLELQKEKRPITLSYIGRVDSSEIKKYSFKSSGKIAGVRVENGDRIEKGQTLVQLDTVDLSYLTESARSQMDALQAQYEKAVNGAAAEAIRRAELTVDQTRDACNYSKDLCEKTEALYESGAVSLDTLNKARLDLKSKTAELNKAVEAEQELKKGTREEDIENLQNQLEAARTNYKSYESLLEAADLKSDIEGYVVEVPVKQGEMTAAGTPVAVVRSRSMAVNIGVAQKDINSINIGTQAEVEIDGRTMPGSVIRIDQVPDKQTWTYNAQLELSDEALYLGVVAKVLVEVGETEGIWMPVSSIMNNGTDYVFIAVDGRAVKKNVSIVKMQGTFVMVNGLSPGDVLVTEGSKALRDGDLINIME